MFDKYSNEELNTLLGTIEKMYEEKKSELIKYLNKQEEVHREMDDLYDRYNSVKNELLNRGNDSEQ